MCSRCSGTPPVGLSADGGVETPLMVDQLQKQSGVEMKDGDMMESVANIEREEQPGRGVETLNTTLCAWLKGTNKCNPSLPPKRPR